MAERMFFQVVDGPLVVRAEPGTRAERIGELLTGAVVEVAPDSRRSREGFVWWRHSLGWCAERSEEDAIVLMQQVNESLADLDTEPSHYRVVDGPLYIRADPDSSAQPVGELSQGEIIAVFPEMRRAGGGLLWVQHLRGWTAVGKVDGSATFMEPSLPPDMSAPEDPVSDEADIVMQPTVNSAQLAPPETRYFRAVQPVYVRRLASPASPKIGEFDIGTIIEVFPGSRAVGGAYVFWQHADGWSAESRADGSDVFMVAIEAMDELDIPTEPEQPDSEPVTPDEPSAEPVSGTPVNNFRVVISRLYIRAEPSMSAQNVGALFFDEIVEIIPGSRTSADGFIWWEHARGWSAQMSVQGDIYMQPERAPGADPEPESPVDQPEPEPEPEPAAPTDPNQMIFEVVDGPISIREEPLSSAEIVGELAQGVTIEVERSSRTLSDGFVWWQHHLGWSTQSDTQNRQHFMLRVPAMKNPRLPEPGRMPDGSPIRFFEVTDGPVSVRAAAGSAAERVGMLYNREQIEVDPDSRTVRDKLVWWRHRQGWSAERTVSAVRIPFMTPLSELTQPPSQGGFVPFPIFSLHPVDLRDTQWIQYYGNTNFAFRLRRDGKTWYNYCQGLHGGFDYGTSRAIPVLAGVEGTVLDVYWNTRTYAPNFCRIRVGPFMVIYGHIARPVAFRAGQPVTPETVVGTIDAGGQNHLHLEVRYKNQIINPLVLMPEALRDQITDRWRDLPKHFYRDTRWSAWQTPLDQPILLLQNKGGERIIGPHTGRLE